MKIYYEFEFHSLIYYFQLKLAYYTPGSLRTDLKKNLNEIKKLEAIWNQTCTKKKKIKSSNNFDQS